MSDLNSLNLREPDPIDWEHYDTGERKPIFTPAKGTYTAVVSEAPEAGATKEGYLMMKIPALTIVAPGTPADGTVIKFTNVSVKKWSNREGSPLGDYLKAFGLSGQRTNEDYVHATFATQGRTCQIVIDWRGYCKGCGTEVKGMDKFPTAADGSKQTWFECPTGCQDQTDPSAPRPKRVWANVAVNYFKAL